MKILTPRQIYEEIQAGNINIENGLDLLIYIVENERERELRASGFMYLQKLKPTSIRYFQFLERLLLSDLDDYIRKLAASTLIHSFALKAYDVIRWALSHEHSSQCIVSMVDLIKECTEQKLQSLLKEIKFVVFDDRVIFPTRSNHLINLNQKSINDIKDLFGLENLHQIEELYLQDNNITRLRGLDQLTNLKHLFLKSNKIEEITGLDSLKNLKTLHLQSNLINEISGLDNLTGLESLFLSRNRINNIKGLENLGNLKTLSLFDNEITEIKELENNISLEELFLRGNHIKEIAGLEKLHNLKRLDLGFNHISNINGLDKLKNLEYLYLNNNMIREISNLEYCRKLKYLNLNSNEIRQLDELEQLDHLEYLYLQNNYISEINNLGSLKALKLIDLKNNDITDINDSLFSLPSLRELTLVQCPIAKNIPSLNVKSKRKNPKLKIVYYSEGDNWYREPISKEIIALKYMPKPLNTSSILQELRNVGDPIEYFSDSLLKIMRYGKMTEIFEISKKGAISRVN